MADDTHRFQCPCCHNELEFDTSSGQVREVGTKATPAQKTTARKTGPKTRGERPTARLEDLVENQKKEEERVGDAFTRAARDTLTQADKFDELFHTALDEAKKDKNKKPRNPFDLD